MILLGLLLSAGAIAQNAASDADPVISDTILDTINDITSSNELAGLKERIGILEEQLKENNRTQSDRSADHDCPAWEEMDFDDDLNEGN